MEPEEASREGLGSLAVAGSLVRSGPQPLRRPYERIQPVLRVGAQGRYRQALPFAEEALRLGKEEFNPDHPAAATLLNNLAELYRVQGRYAEAESLHRRALAI